MPTLRLPPNEKRRLFPRFQTPNDLRPHPLTSILTSLNPTKEEREWKKPSQPKSRNVPYRGRRPAGGSKNPLEQKRSDLDLRRRSQNAGTEFAQPDSTQNPRIADLIARKLRLAYPVKSLCPSEKRTSTLTEYTIENDPAQPNPSNPTPQNQSDRMSTASDHGIPERHAGDVMDEILHASMVLAPGTHLPTVLNMETRDNIANENPGEDDDDPRGSGAATPTPDPPLPTYDQEKLKIPRDRNLRPNGTRPEQGPTDPGFAEFLTRVATAPASLNNGWMPEFVRDLETSLSGFPEEMRQEVLEHAEEWILLTIFNGGVYLFRRIPDMAQKVADFLLNIGIDFEDILAPYRDKIEEEAALTSRARGRGGVNPQATRGRGRGRGRGGKATVSKAQGGDAEDKYSGSTTLAVRISDIDQRHYLLGLGTTALDTLVALHATKVWHSPEPVPYERSWAAGLFHTNQYGRTSDVMTDNLAYTVKLTLWNSVAFGDLIA
ncbi:hypothetical protein EV360DRAFT_75488 [Lentinula raphanica]|nr:hypothetical protein EV360DRAFT_75488 [Lentinula raphanica]